MKKKSLKRIIVFSVLGVMLTSQLAFAGTTYFDFRLPSTGSMSTNSVTKETASSNPYADISYFGWGGSGIDCWMYSSEGDGQLTSRANFSGTGRVNMWMVGDMASWYVGHPVHMNIKTDEHTWHECDVEGVFNPR